MADQPSANKLALPGPHVPHWSGISEAGIPWTLNLGDARKVLSSLPANHYRCVVTSPPYFWQRDYKVEGQIGLETTIKEYVNNIADAMDKVKLTLHKEGVLFLVLGDTYYSGRGEPKGRDRKNSARRFGLRAVDAGGLGVPNKSLIGVPWRVALEMVDRGWILRSPIIWHTGDRPPEPTAQDRPWRSYGMVFLFCQSRRYHFDREALNGEEDVWNIPARLKVTNGQYAAAFPEELVDRCLKVGCVEAGPVLDPFAGSGTVLKVSLRTGRPATGIELNPTHCNYIVRTLSKF